MARPRKEPKRKGPAKCLRCRSNEHTRIVATEPGYNPNLTHYVCDNCEIGWYMKSGARSGSVFSGYSPEALKTVLDAAKKAYIPEGRIYTPPR